VKRAAAPCAEFPNDNPELHLGATWTVEEPCASPSPVIRQIEWESVTVVDIDTAIRMLDEEPISAEQSEWSDLEEVDEKTEQMAMQVSMTTADEGDDIVIEEFEDTVFESTETFTAEDKKEIVFETDPAVNARTETLAPPAPLAAPSESEIADSVKRDPNFAIALESVTASLMLDEPPPVASEPAIVEDAPVASEPAVAIAAPPPTEAVPEVATVTPIAESSARSSSDPFVSYMTIVAEIALAQGDAVLATRLPTLLEEGDCEGLPDGVKPLLGALPAWRGMIRGEEVDFASCGASMLDEWTADLIAIALGDPARAPQIKQALRARGVAAFGLLEAA
jgi:hypothetical protein